MKRIALILLCGLLGCTLTQAQVVSTRSAYEKVTKVKKERVPLKFEFYGKVGLNIMTSDWNGLEYNPDGLNSKPTVGFDLSFGFLSHFHPSRPSNFYWGAEISLTQVGGAFEGFSYIHFYWSHGKEFIFPSTKFSNFGFSITPTIGWKKALSKGVSLDLHLNPGCLFLFKEGEVEYTISSGGTDYCTVDEIPNFNLKAGVGVWIKRFNIDFSYRIAKNMELVYYRNFYSNFILSVGYRF